MVGDWFPVGSSTFTVTVSEALPPVPVHVNVKLVVTLNGPTLSPVELLVSLGPSQPSLAKHPVASVDVQVRVANSPGATFVETAVRLTVGAGVVALRVMNQLNEIVVEPPHNPSSYHRPGSSRERLEVMSGARAAKPTPSRPAATSANAPPRSRRSRSGVDI